MNLSKTNVILLGHGVSEGTGSDEFILKYAELLRSQPLFANVYEAFVRQRPNIFEVLKNVNEGAAYIVPMFMCPGFILQKTFNELTKQFPIYSDCYKSGHLIQKENIRFYFCEPIGTHSLMADIIVSKAINALRKHPYPRLYNPNEVSLFIAAHGCSKDTKSRQTVQVHIDALLRRKIFSDIHSVFLEEKPLVSDCFKLAERDRIVVVPFFAGNGPHVREDIPILLGESRNEVIKRIELGLSPIKNPTERNGKLVWYAEPAGDDPRIIDIIIRRIIELAYC
ncbi:MAG: CbiX/SirB N-terminal domain-containing protein [Verrucomicrobiia bacterium]